MQKNYANVNWNDSKTTNEHLNFTHVDTRNFICKSLLSWLYTL